MPEMSLQAAWARLDKQAAAIKALRAEIRALKEAGARSSTETPVQGTYVYSPACVMCHEDKAGRTALTCKPCGTKWMDGIRGVVPRTNFPTCCNCGAAKGNNTKMLCPPCSGSFRVWKAQH